MATTGRTLLAFGMIVAGILHFAIPQPYLKIMPPYLPWHLPLVYLSGVAEILCGAGLLIPPTRHIAAWSLIALYVAVMPANIYMITDHANLPSIPLWALWVRLPLQLPLIYWASLYTRA